MYTANPENGAGLVGFVVFVVVGIAIVTVHEERIVVIVGIGGTEPPFGNNEVLT